MNWLDLSAYFQINDEEINCGGERVSEDLIDISLIAVCPH
jgi:hypothetical protein